MMSLSAATQEAQTLRKAIQKYNIAFFQEGKSLISDYEFDQLVKKLEALETKYPSLQRADSPTQRVGEAPSKAFASVAHTYPMYSLSNTYDHTEVQDFAKRLTKQMPEAGVDYFCELKLDGVAMSLTYHHGELVRIVTRGDGQQGDDITRNQKLIKNIPQKLLGANIPEEVAIRGEVFMSHADFSRLNAYYKAEGRSPLSNPRNGTAGLLRTKEVNPSLFDNPPLTLGAYGVMGKKLTFATQAEALSTARTWGFFVSPTGAYCKDLEAVFAYINKWESERKALPMDIDGIVIKVNTLHHQRLLGHTAKSPRWAIAYKYKPLAMETRLLGITWQVGRTGAIVPVAELAPVHLAGTIVKRATLHNLAEIERLGLHVGDYVYVEKGGDIIPKITGVNKKKRNKESLPYHFDKQCPSCGVEVLQEEGEAHYYCPNTKNCIAQLKKNLVHFIARKAMDMDSIGPQTIDLLFNHELVRYPADLYQLTYEQIAALEGFQEKSTTHFFRALNTSKEVPFGRVLFALGIRHVGATVAHKLATHFKSMEKLAAASHEALIEIPEVGEKIAASLHKYFADPQYQTHWQALQAAGLSLEIKATASQPMHTTLEGKTFVVTGLFEGMTRESMHDYIQNHGGQVLGGISKKVNYLVLGASAGATKVQKATKLEIPTLSWEALEQMASPSS